MLLPLMATAQVDRQLIRQGNRLYHAQKYDQAESTYRKACAANKENGVAQYNLGCALLAQQKDSAAVTCFENAAKMQPDKMRRAQAYHNIGVICQGKKMWGEAIEAYKESLRCNPKDNETRYNLALCMKQKKNDDKNKNNQDKNKDQNKDKNKDQNKAQNKDQNKDQQKDKNKDQNKQNQNQQEKMSKDNAEQLLNAAVQQEKATQQKLKKAQAQPRQNRHQKNW